MKKIPFLHMAAMAAVLSLASCSDDESESVNNEPGQVTAAANTEAATDYDYSATAKQVNLAGSSATSDDETVTTEGSKVTITQSGVYHVSGTLADGQLVVDADENAVVKLVFDGVSITSSTNAAVDIENADKVIIRVQQGTTNTITDASGNSQNGAIYSRTKLSIFGTGTLTVNGNDAAAIRSEGGVVLKESTFILNADDAAVSTDFNITVPSGDFTVNAQGDGFSADTDINITGGTINIAQSQDGFEAGAVNIAAGTVRITASADGIDADGANTTANTEIYLKGGYLYVNAAQNGLDAQGNIVVDGGTLVIDGPTAGSSAAVNFTGNFNINNGVVVAVSGNGTIDAPSETSGQNAVLLDFESTQDAETVVHLQSTTGANLFTFKPAHSFKKILVSTAAVADNGSYQLYTGGTVTGDITDGWYDFISYIGGVLQATFTVTGTVTTVQSANL